MHLSVIFFICISFVVQRPWVPLTIPEVCPQTDLSPYDYIYCEFCFDSETNTTDEEMAKVYKKWPIKTLTNDVDLESPPMDSSIFRYKL